MDNKTPLLRVAYRKPAKAKGGKGYEHHQGCQKEGLAGIIAFSGAFWYYFLHIRQYSII